MAFKVQNYQQVFRTPTRRVEEVKELRSRTYWREVKPDHDPTIHQHAQAGSQVERRKQHLINPI
jgi:hypothetical protein